MQQSRFICWKTLALCVVLTFILMHVVFWPRRSCAIHEGAAHCHFRDCAGDCRRCCHGHELAMQQCKTGRRSRYNGMIYSITMPVIQNHLCWPFGVALHQGWVDNWVGRRETVLPLTQMPTASYYTVLPVSAYSVAHVSVPCGPAAALSSPARPQSEA